jgi:hypothetical protein
VARKYGVRELIYPGSEQIKLLTGYLSTAIEMKRSGPVPKTAVVVMLDFLQATINRQHITKIPTMSQQEYDLLQTPYYLAARVVNKFAREHQKRTGGVSESGKLYQTTYLSINTFIELLRSLIDPGCYWLRVKELPEGVIEAMDALREFAAEYPEQRRKGRAM